MLNMFSRRGTFKVIHFSQEVSSLLRNNDSYKECHFLKNSINTFETGNVLSTSLQVRKMIIIILENNIFLYKFLDKFK